MEMETFRDILCRQIETLQSYFDSCASAVAHGTVNDCKQTSFFVCVPGIEVAVGQINQQWDFYLVTKFDTIGYVSKKKKINM